MQVKPEVAGFATQGSRDGMVRHLHQVDLAERWRVSPRTLERWRWKQQGPQYVKLGGRVVYRLEDVEAFETRQMRECGACAP